MKRVFFGLFVYMALLVTLIIFIWPGALLLIFSSLVTLACMYTEWWITRVPRGHCTVLRDTAGVLSVIEEGTHFHPFKYAMHYATPNFPDITWFETTRYICKWSRTIRFDYLYAIWNNVRHNFRLKIRISVTGPEQLDYLRGIGCLNRNLTKVLFVQHGIEEILKLIKSQEINKELQKFGLVIERIEISKIKPARGAYAAVFSSPIPANSDVDKNSIV